MQEKVLEKENEAMYQWASLMSKQQEEINQQQVATMTELKLVGQEHQLFEHFPFYGSSEENHNINVLQLDANLPELQLQSYNQYRIQPAQPNLQESTSDAQHNIYIW
ncbi:hypothetical protein E3N88_45456 [Mikania micrantha]|uniref:Uncharacterized protein n=1 Tax=Mikania micrantha TaxID=192012 RepID=A0A5N6L994_9ASTR|nr:hypothetical protein E3N88_45456 [Mikania micrantha]